MSFQSFSHWGMFEDGEVETEFQLIESYDFNRPGLLYVRDISIPSSVPRKLELSTIDPDADYTIVPSRTRK